MQFINLKEEIRSVSFHETRTDCDNYFEGVIVKSELGKLTDSLEKFLGVPVWPSKNTLSMPMRKAVDGFGGIMPGQTLYFWSGAAGAEAVFAMLWPWSDGERTTVKIIKCLDL